MKIKTIEDFTIEECQEFLDCFPEDERASAIREHMTALMKEKEQQMEQSLRWIDVKQLKAKKHRPNVLLSLSMISAVLVICYELLPAFYDYTYFDNVLFVLVGIILSAITIREMFLRLHFFSKVYDVEDSDDDVLIVRDRKGNYSLYDPADYHRLVAWTPDPIIKCCVGVYKHSSSSLAKRAVCLYNAKLRKDVLCGCEEIDMLDNGNFMVNKGDTIQEYDKEGYRIIRR